MKFKVGDKVKLDISDNSRRTDFLADLQMNLTDRTISSRNYDVTLEAIEGGKEFTVTKVNNERWGISYELKIGKHELSFCPDEEDLILVSTKEADAQDDKLLANIAKMEKAAAQISDAEAVKAQAARIRDLVSENQRLRKAAQMVIDDFDQTGCTKDIGTVMGDNIDALRTALGES